MTVWFRRLLWLLVVTALLASASAWLWTRYIEQQAKGALVAVLTTDLTLHIARGTSLNGIAQQAVSAGVPVSSQQFIALAKRLRIDAALQAGKYRFKAGQSVEQVLRDLADGKVIVEKITLIEGKSFADIKAQLRQDKRLTHQLSSMNNDDIRQALGITEKHLEGLFLPETYFFTPADSDLSILQRAHQRLLHTLEEQWENRTDQKTLKTPYEALILASIIEKETGQAEERPLIASVFANRLAKGIRLQADPTIIYGLGERYQGNLTRAHLQEDNPYNTYRYAGLPPTPIALVGEAAIKAALNPADSDYYYFVATGNGSHHFSSSLREHNNAVNRYQRKQ